MTKEEFWTLDMHERASAWTDMTRKERDVVRSDAELTPQLVGLEGWRVEVLEHGEKRRFIVGRSTGWQPCHIELKRRDSNGGMSASKRYDRVRRLEDITSASYR